MKYFNLTKARYRARFLTSEFRKLIAFNTKTIVFGIPFVIALFLVAIPTRWLSDLYFVGGDNSQLYYLMPREMMNNYLFNIISDNTLGTLGVFGQQLYQAPFFGLLYLLKTLSPAGTNIQALCFGLNLAFSFLGFYWLLSLWIRGVTTGDLLIRATAALAYCSSVYIVLTLWKHALYALYLSSLVPVILYLVFLGARKQRLHFIVAAALIATLFSVCLMSVPWLLGTILIVSPLLVWHQIYFHRTLPYCIYFVIILVGLNIFWLAPMIYSIFSPNSSYDALHTTGTVANHIQSVTAGNSVAYPLLGNPMPRWAESTEQAWFGSMLANATMSLVIISAGVLVRKSNPLLGIYLAGLFCWILSIYFYTIRIGSWGMEFFIIFSESIPGFIMFRNNFDKFALGVAFSLCFLFAISARILLATKFASSSKVVRKTYLTILALAVSLSSFSFLSTSQYDSPLWSTRSTYTTISRFNDDFNELTDYLKAQPNDSKYLWLPLNSAGYVQIADNDLANHFYVGTSPLRFLADKSDYTGRFSFGADYVGDKLLDDIVENNYDDVINLLRKMNIGYVIVNNDLNIELINSYLHKRDYTADLYYTQMNNLRPLILGAHVRDFGDRYSVYEIRSDIFLSKLHLAGSMTTKLDWEKVSSSKYVLTLENFEDTALLFFLEPYHRDWTLFTKDGLKLSSPLIQHGRIFDYANGWKLDLKSLQLHLSESDYGHHPSRSPAIELTLEFTPARWLNYGGWASGLVLMICLLYITSGFISWKFPIWNQAGAK